MPDDLTALLLRAARLARNGYDVTVLEKNATPGGRANQITRDGHRFDQQAFHDQVIGHGSLPLDVLREQLPAWVEPRAG